MFVWGLEGSGVVASGVMLKSKASLGLVASRLATEMQRAPAHVK